MYTVKTSKGITEQSLKWKTFLITAQCNHTSDLLTNKGRGWSKQTQKRLSIQTPLDNWQVKRK